MFRRPLQPWLLAVRLSVELVFPLSWRWPVCVLYSVLSPPSPSVWAGVTHCWLLSLPALTLVLYCVCSVLYSSSSLSATFPASSHPRVIFPLFPGPPFGRSLLWPVTVATFLC